MEAKNDPTAVTPHVEKAADSAVPGELVDRLHQANQKFHDDRRGLESQIDGTEYRHQEKPMSLGG